MTVLVLLASLETLSHYLNIEGSHLLAEDVPWITDTVFREKPMV